METTQKRKSNYELLRIILMLGIISNHYVVNSGITNLYNYNNITANMIFLQFLGSFGKLGINCFLLLTGYFMVKQNFSLKKFIRLYLEIKFYKIVIYLIFMMTGYSTFDTNSFIRTLFNVLFSIGYGRSFPEVFLVLYLLSPFLNILISNLNNRKHILLLSMLIFFYSIIVVVINPNNSINYIGWFITMYLTGSYIRLYQNEFFKNRKLHIVLITFTILFMWISIIFIDYFYLHMGKKANYYYWIVDSNKISVYILSISIFCLFSTINIEYNRFINYLSSSVFGILLIHANSDTMRQFLWQDLLNNQLFYNSNFLIFHAIFSIIGVYIVCFFIDRLRIRLFENPLFDYLNNNIKLV